MGNGYYTAMEAADILKYSRRSIYNMIRAGRIPAVRIERKWLIPKDWVNNLINNREVIDAVQHKG